MATRKIKPTTPSRRFTTFQEREELTSERPHKPLTDGKSSSGGRNVGGAIPSRHRGGGAKRRYRRIDFNRRKDGVPARVATIEYDPNRTCFIALLHYADGDKRYILAPQGLAPGAQVGSGAPRAPRSRWSRRRARWSRCGCPRRRFGWCAGRPGPRSARCPTPSTRTSSSARRAASAISA